MFLGYTHIQKLKTTLDEVKKFNEGKDKESEVSKMINFIDNFNAFKYDRLHKTKQTASKDIKGNFSNNISKPIEKKFSMDNMARKLLLTFTEKIEKIIDKVKNMRDKAKDKIADYSYSQNNFTFLKTRSTKRALENIPKETNSLCKANLKDIHGEDINEETKNDIDKVFIPKNR
jgi:organic radical activating enzyme